MNSKSEKIAVITGVSNEKGIGAAICRRLATEGIDIFFTHWNADSNWEENFRNEMIELGVRCTGIELDLSRSDSPELLIREVTSMLGIPSILVNNAAHSIDSNFMDLDAKVLNDHYYVNVRATSLLCVEFARLMQKTNRKFGRIINLTSGQQLGPMPGNLAYVATKGAITSFTLSLSAELAHLGITVNAVNPGPTDSTWMTDEIREYLRPKFPMGRIGQPDDAARIISFLASEDASWITGQVIHSEGGFYRG
ncbi:SDR family oxidoreductase [Metabacillus halosaccharovorans]|uniref:SDR family oxidoreductase n=1 Tax=Metabacillus halosaccharovorans TaxID=930124 RepID=UPI001C1FBBD3|nr:SDR family oxidoreductase [Metabacillus halosaccharovorans]MBU7592900.1 SDR family oxidoreductase [Metabacillus halosaccharovorans]